MEKKKSRLISSLLQAVQARHRDRILVENLRRREEVKDRGIKVVEFKTRMNNI